MLYIQTRQTFGEATKEKTYVQHCFNVWSALEIMAQHLVMVGTTIQKSEKSEEFC